MTRRLRLIALVALSLTFASDISLATAISAATGSIAAAQTPTGYATNGDVRIAYYITGSGPPLLLINGGPGFPATHFRPLAETLAGRLHMQIIRFDQRGTGLSHVKNLSGKTITLRLMDQDIDAVRRSLHLRRWVVMGHSFGGLNAMSYATEYPDQIRALILSAPGGADLAFTRGLGRNIDARLTPAERAIVAEGAKAKPGSPAARRGLAATLSAYINHKKNLPYLVRALVDSNLFVPAVNNLVFQNLIATHFDLKPRLRMLRVPCLILQGDSDPLGRDVVETTHRSIPDSELIVIADSSHYMWLDQPAAYFGDIGTFVSSHQLNKAGSS